MSLRAWLEIGLTVLLIGLGWSAYSSMKSFGEAVALAERAAGETLEARRRADSADALADAERARAEEAIARAERERDRADRIADSLEAVGARLSVEVIESGASLTEAIENAQAGATAQQRSVLDSIAIRLVRHLEADAQQAENFRLRLAEMEHARTAVGLLAGAWEVRALASETALAARELECQRCAVEVERWRAAAQPSFFRGLLDDAGKLVVAVGGTVIVILLL